MQYWLDRREFDDFGEALEAYRSKRQVSMGRLARAAGVSTSYVSRLESGERAIPSQLVVLRLAAVLRLETAETNTLLWHAGHAPLELL